MPFATLPTTNSQLFYGLSTFTHHDNIYTDATNTTTSQLCDRIASDAAALTISRDSTLNNASLNGTSQTPPSQNPPF